MLRVRDAPKTREKTREKIIRFLRENNALTIEELAEKLGMSEKGVEWHIAILTRKGILVRIGGRKEGHWEVKSEGISKNQDESNLENAPQASPQVTPLVKDTAKDTVKDTLNITEKTPRKTREKIREKTGEENAPEISSQKSSAKGNEWYEQWYERWYEKGLTERDVKLIAEIKTNSIISIKHLSDKIGINPSAIQKHIEKLKQKGFLKRIGPDKGGHWEIIE